MVFPNHFIGRLSLVRFMAFALTGLIVSSGFGWSQQPQGYQNYNDLSQSLKNLVQAHKDLARLESIGKTAEGRDIWLLTIAKSGGTPIDQRPGLLIAANFEAGHLIGSSLSVSVADYLLKGYPTDQEIRKSIDDHVYYIIPRMNPDGAETWFAKLKTGQKTNNNPSDADNDGRLDEDGPEDLNNDGLITVMRVKDPNGIYRIDPEEPMLMKKADASKGEPGEYSIYPEGIDNDNDGFINEDAAGGTDLNRNFMHAYPYFKENAGRHMVSEPETRALLDWVIVNRNIAMVLTFGESDNLIVPPSSRGQLSSDRPLDLINFAQASVAGASRTGMVSAGGRGFDRFSFMMMAGGRGGRSGQQQATQESSRSQRPAQTPATTVNTADIDYFNKVSEKYKELTSIKTQPVLRNPEGAFFQYAYFHYGVPSFSTPGWGIALPADTSRRASRGGVGARPGGNDTPAAMAGAFGRGGQSMAAMSGAAAGQGESGGPAPGIDAQFLKWLKTSGGIGFVNWQTAKHPEYGEVEVGGFSPLEIWNPSPDKIAELGTSHAKFAVYLSTLYARIKVAKTEVSSLGGGLFMIRAEIENEGFLPTALRHGVQSRSVKPTMVQLGVKPEQILSGNNKTNFFQALDGSGRRMKYEWMIKGKPGDKIELKVVSQKAGTDTATITLK